MDSNVIKFDFIKTHYNEARRDFELFRIHASATLVVMEDRIDKMRQRGIVGREIDEIDRDRRVYIARLKRISEGMERISTIIEDTDRLLFSMGPVVAEKSANSILDAFMRWMHQRQDFCNCFMATVDKWQESSIRVE